MSERFRIVFLTNPIIHSPCSIEDTEQPIITYYNDLTYNMGSAKQICELLNQLNNENGELKEELTCYKSANDKLQKELIKKVEEKSKLKIENKQLKNEIKELNELLNLKISERTFALEQELKE